MTGCVLSRHVSRTHGGRGRPERPGPGARRSAATANAFGEGQSSGRRGAARSSTKDEERRARSRSVPMRDTGLRAGMQAAELGHENPPGGTGGRRTTSSARPAFRRGRREPSPSCFRPPGFRPPGSRFRLPGFAGPEGRRPALCYDRGHTTTAAPAFARRTPP